MNPISEACQQHATRLAHNLIGRGALHEPWIEAFTQTPRHLFLPSFYSRTDSTWDLITPKTVGQERWLHMAYQDVTWVQRLDGPESTPGTPASSSIQPSLAAQMLTALSAGPGHRVLEIGAGTGWLTALLTHRCGTGSVTGLEIDPELVNQARTALDALGHEATLMQADGYTGFTDHAPYDQIVSTASVSHIPPAWLSQIRPGGRIVAPLRGAVVVMNVHRHDNAAGRFHPAPVQILPLRSAHDPGHHISVTEPASDPGSRPTSAAMHDQRFRFFAGLRHPDLTFDHRGPMEDHVVKDTHGSSVAIPALGDVRVQGTRDIWESVSHAYHQWKQLGCPGPEDIVLDVDSDGQWVRPIASPIEERWRIW